MNERLRVIGRVSSMTDHNVKHRSNPEVNHHLSLKWFIYCAQFSRVLVWYELSGPSYYLMPLVQQGIVFMWNNGGNHWIYQRDKWFEIICCE